MKKLALILAVVLGMSTLANAISINIDVGDQPYYTHGARYWARGAYWCWVPGHWNRHHTVWIHGHYRSC
jgi:hypothetical protein